MIIIDANLLLYASHELSPKYEAADRWLQSALSGDELVRLPWSSIHAFLRLSTHASILEAPFTPMRALQIVHSWLRQPNVDVVEPGPNYWSILHRLILDTPARGNLVMDAHLAALAIEHQATIYSADRDFRRFSGVRVVNPLP